MGDGAAPENFTTVAEVKDITGPAQSTDVQDVTNQSSPGGYEEIAPTIRRSGEVDFDVNFIPGDATHNATTGMIAALNNKTKKNWYLQLNNIGANYWSFAAYCIGFQTKAPVAGVLAGTVKLKITGQPVLH